MELNCWELANIATMESASVLESSNWLENDVVWNCDCNDDYNTGDNISN